MGWKESCPQAFHETVGELRGATFSVYRSDSNGKGTARSAADEVEVPTFFAQLLTLCLVARCVSRCRRPPIAGSDAVRAAAVARVASGPSPRPPGRPPPARRERALSERTTRRPQVKCSAS